MQSLTELSLADNQLRSLPQDLSGWSSLQKFYCYSNCITELPLGPTGLPALLPAPQDPQAAAAAAAARSAKGSSANYDDYDGSSSNGSSKNAAIKSIDPSDDSSGSSSGRLVSLWLEGNPLSEACVAGVLEKLGAAGTTRVGLDEQQLVGAAALRYSQLKAAGNKAVRRGIIQVRAADADRCGACCDELLPCMSQSQVAICTGHALISSEELVLIRGRLAGCPDTYAGAAGSICEGLS